MRRICSAVKMSLTSTVYEDLNCLTSTVYEDLNCRELPRDTIQ